MMKLSARPRDPDEAEAHRLDTADEVRVAGPLGIELRVEGAHETAYLDWKGGPLRCDGLASLETIARSLSLLPTAGKGCMMFRTKRWSTERTR